VGTHRQNGGEQVSIALGAPLISSGGVGAVVARAATRVTTNKAPVTHSAARSTTRTTTQDIRIATHRAARVVCGACAATHGSAQDARVVRSARAATHGAAKNARVVRGARAATHGSARVIGGPRAAARTVRAGARTSSTLAGFFLPRLLPLLGQAFFVAQQPRSARASSIHRVFPQTVITLHRT